MSFLKDGSTSYYSSELVRGQGEGDTGRECKQKQLPRGPWGIKLEAEPDTMSDILSYTAGCQETRMRPVRMGSLKLPEGSHFLFPRLREIMQVVRTGFIQGRHSCA